MQILKNLYQVGGDLNGITFDEKGALWNDGNSYVLKTSEGLIMFDYFTNIIGAGGVIVCTSNDASATLAENR